MIPGMKKRYIIIDADILITSLVPIFSVIHYGHFSNLLQMVQWSLQTQDLIICTNCWNPVKYVCFLSSEAASTTANYLNGILVNVCSKHAPFHPLQCSVRIGEISVKFFST